MNKNNIIFYKTAAIIFKNNKLAMGLSSLG
jgi:hypothetical protein